MSEIEQIYSSGATKQPKETVLATQASLEYRGSISGSLPEYGGKQTTLPQRKTFYGVPQMQRVCSQSQLLSTKSSSSNNPPTATDRITDSISHSNNKIAELLQRPTRQLQRTSLGKGAQTKLPSRSEQFISVRNEAPLQEIDMNCKPNRKYQGMTARSSLMKANDMKTLKNSGGGGGSFLQPQNQKRASGVIAIGASSAKRQTVFQFASQTSLPQTSQLNSSKLAPRGGGL